jgi:carboxymethylenebutenolidase
VGFSYGGRAAFLAAVSFTLGASVSWYANGIAHRSFTYNPLLDTLADRPLKTPWLGLFGETDQLVSTAELGDLRTLLGDQPVAHEVVSYPGVGHAFDVDHSFPGRPSSYNAEAAGDAELRTQAFLAAHLDA